MKLLQYFSNQNQWPAQSSPSLNSHFHISLHFEVHHTISFQTITNWYKTAITNFIFQFRKFFRLIQTFSFSSNSVCLFYDQELLYTHWYIWLLCVEDFNKSMMIQNFFLLYFQFFLLCNICLFSFFPLYCWASFSFHSNIVFTSLSA